MFHPIAEFGKVSGKKINTQKVRPFYRSRPITEKELTISISFTIAAKFI